MPPTSTHFRVHSRRVVQLTGSCAFGMGEPLRIRIENLGLGGACISHVPGIGEGTGVRLSFMTPSRWDPVILEGEVLWVKPKADKMGVRFDGKDPVALLALYDFLGSLVYDIEPLGSADA